MNIGSIRCIFVKRPQPTSVDLHNSFCNRDRNTTLIGEEWENEIVWNDSSMRPRGGGILGAEWQVVDALDKPE